MSVSLRERVAEIIDELEKELRASYKADGCVTSAITDTNKNTATQRICSLFPAQFTEEEVEILINKVKAETDPIAFTSVLAQALISKCGNKDMVTREYACDMALKAKKSGWDDALKYYKINEATPTFSGGEKEEIPDK